jgi:5-methylthioadenosine/S-adenosylhomocysteine deaminase
LSRQAALAVRGAVLGGETVGLRCAEGHVEALGPDVQPRGGEATIEADGAALIAPLLNGHTHAAMTLFRGKGGDLGLMRWLEQRVWPIEAKLEAKDVYRGARLACLEMIRTVTTCFWDMYWHPAASARAVRDAGLRATIGGPLLDAGTVAPKQICDRALHDLAELEELGGRVASAVAPHSIYTASEGLLRWAAELSSERGLPIQIHLSETKEEVAECVEIHGMRPAAYLDRLGILSEALPSLHWPILGPARAD